MVCRSIDDLRKQHGPNWSQFVTITGPSYQTEEACKQVCPGNCGNSSSLGDRHCASDEVCVGYCPNNNFMCTPKCADGYYPFWAGPWGYSPNMPCLAISLEVSNQSDPNHPANGLYCLDTGALCGGGGNSFYIVHYINIFNSLYGILNIRPGWNGPASQWVGTEQPYGQRSSWGTSSNNIDQIPNFSAQGFTVTVNPAGCP